ncbi:unnamed protein product [Chrysoparadoxa australica]
MGCAASSSVSAAPAPLEAVVPGQETGVEEGRELVVRPAQVDPRPSLLEAAKAGDSMVLKRLLEQGEDGNARGMWDNTPLLNAVLYDQVDAALTLVFAGTDLDAVNDKGVSALLWASLEGQEAVVEALVEAGCTINPTPATILNPTSDAIEKLTPIVAAAGAGHCHIIEVLLTAGASAEHCSAGVLPPLMAASRGGHEEAINLLLKHGADPLVESDGETCLLLACEGKKQAAAASLLEAVSESDRLRLVRAARCDETTPLHLCCSKRLEGLVEKLLDAGAELEAKDSLGATALLAACSAGFLHGVQLLLSRGADREARDAAGATAVDRAERCKRPQAADIIELLQGQGVAQGEDRGAGAAAAAGSDVTRQSAPQTEAAEAKGASQEVASVDESAEQAEGNVTTSSAAKGCKDEGELVLEEVKGDDDGPEAGVGLDENSGRFSVEARAEAQAARKLAFAVVERCIKDATRNLSALSQTEVPAGLAEESDLVVEEIGDTTEGVKGAEGREASPTTNKASKKHARGITNEHKRMR